MNTQQPVSWIKPSDQLANEDIEGIICSNYSLDNEIDLLDTADSLDLPNLSCRERSSIEKDLEEPQISQFETDKQARIDARIEARLSKRTNKVIEAYKNYLAEIDFEQVSVSSHKSTKSTFIHDDNLQNVEESRKPYRDTPDQEDYSHISMDNALSSSDNIVYRSWANKHGTITDPPDIDNTFLGYDDIIKAGVDTELNYARTTSYKNPWLHSKRVRRAVFILVAAAILIGIITGVAKAKKNSNLLDWEAKLAEVQKEELEKHQLQQHVPTHAADAPDTNLIGISRPPLSDKMEVIVPPLNHSSTDETYSAANNILSKEEQQLILDLTKNFDPLWFNRSDNWSGQTYSKAIEFCASKESRMPCPYDVICPLGKEKSPFGGIKDGSNGSFAPIIDSPNSWVQVGHEGTCELFSSLHGNLPRWGLTGEGNEEVTRNILCCKDTNREERPMPEDNSLQNLASSPSYETETAIAASESSEFVDLTAAEKNVLDTMHPLWFGRKHGYHGTTHDHAVEFCKNVGNMILCPANAYCPNMNEEQNESPLFLKMDAFEGEQWAPTSSNSNSWILVGVSDGDSKTTCKTHEELHAGNLPVWGTDGTFTSMKENILCCVNPSSNAMVDSVGANVDDGSYSSTVGNDSTSNSATSIYQTIDLEQQMQDRLKPLWLGSKEGWNGGSHADALAFCENFREMKLCPYSAYCPHGSSQPVMGRHRVDFNAEGVQYAPVFGQANHWIMIGQKEQNPVTTCMSHYQLEGSEPDWGLSNDRPEIKKHILCCTFN